MEFVKIRAVTFSDPPVITAALHLLLEPFGGLDMTKALSSTLKGKISFAINNPQPVTLEQLWRATSGMVHAVDGSPYILMDKSTPLMRRAIFHNIKEVIRGYPERAIRKPAYPDFDGPLNLHDEVRAALKFLKDGHNVTGLKFFKE